MAASKAKLRAKAAKRQSQRTNDPTHVLSTGVMANDGLRPRVAEVREVRVTARVSIKRTFNAPRIEMGEYTPVSTVALELEKLGELI